jgi:hypothetical protein
MLPAENGTMMRTACSGYLETSWANAPEAAAMVAMVASRMLCRRRMSNLPLLAVMVGHFRSRQSSTKAMAGLVNSANGAET